VERVRARLSQFWVGDDQQKPTAEALEEARSHGGHDPAELEAEPEFQGVNELGLPRKH
jgi:hypothetical protein